MLKFLDSRIEHHHSESSAPSSDAPTMETPITGARTILGTFQYMAPEQIEGREADGRTDIFAFGVVLYKMVTGLRAFEMASQAGLIGAILMKEPRPIREVDATVPPLLNQLVRRCLAKSPDERWQHARDLLWQLTDLGDGTERSREIASGRSWRPHALWTGALIAAVATTGLVMSRTARSPASLSGPIRAGIDLPENDGLVLGITRRSR